MDGDALHEIISGAGPGAVFGPHVRGWNVDGGAWDGALDLGRVGALGHSTAIYLHLDEQEVTANLFKTPFKFLRSQFSAEIKSRFGPMFYFAVAKHLRAFMMGKADSLVKADGTRKCREERTACFNPPGGVIL